MKKTTILALAALMAGPAMVSAQGQQGHMQQQQMQEHMQRMQQQMDQMIQRMGQMQERLQAMEQHMQQAMQGDMQQQMTQQQLQQQQHMSDVAGAMREMTTQMRATMMQVRTMAQDPTMHEDGAFQQEMERLREHMQGMVDEMASGMQVLERLQERTGQTPPDDGAQ